MNWMDVVHQNGCHASVLFHFCSFWSCAHGGLLSMQAAWENHGHGESCKTRNMILRAIDFLSCLMPVSVPSGKEAFTSWNAGLVLFPTVIYLAVFYSSCLSATRHSQRNVGKGTGVKRVAPKTTSTGNRAKRRRRQQQRHTRELEISPSGMELWLFEPPGPQYSTLTSFSGLQFRA